MQGWSGQSRRSADDEEESRDAYFGSIAAQEGQPNVIVVASANGAVGIPAALRALESGGTVLDAVEQGIRVVEDNPDDHTVGYSGYPNIHGDVELDASIMEGAGRRAGAVGAVRGFRHPITVARAVMELLPHVLLVADGAAEFARYLGMQPEELLTAEARRTWELGLAGHFSREYPLSDWVGRVRQFATDPELAGGTVNLIARDDLGHLAVGVSTSGAAWKFPGRVGDSAVIGAGNYCEDGVGAAACTGLGELSIRGGTARAVVEALRRGSSLEAAVESTIASLTRLSGVPLGVAFHIVAVGADGDHYAATTKEGWEYAFQSSGMPEPEVVARHWVDISRRARD